MASVSLRASTDDAPLHDEVDLVEDLDAMEGVAGHGDLA